MKLISEENDKSIFAVVHWRILGDKIQCTPLIAIPIPTGKIKDIQSYLKEEFLKRSHSIIKNAEESVQSKLIESINNATFSDIQYIEDFRKVYSIEDHDKDIEIYE